MENEQNNSNNTNPDNQNANNSYHEHPHGAHPYTGHHHHGPHHHGPHHHGCGFHTKREPFMCNERFCAQKILFKLIKVMLVLGIMFMIFMSGVVVGAHIGARRSDSREYRIQSIPYERSIRGNSSQQYEIQIEPGHQMQKDYYFRFGN